MLGAMLFKQTQTPFDVPDINQAKELTIGAYASPTQVYV